MDSYTNKNYEQEIDLKDLMFSVLRKWRPIIIIAIIFAILLSGYKMLKGINQLNDEEYIKTNQETYDLSVDQYNTTKARLEKEIQNLQDNIKNQQEYSENSILMNINPYDEYVACTTLYISTDYQIMPGTFYQNPNVSTSILRAYMSIAQNGEMYNYVLNKINTKNDNSMSLRYLKELVKLEPDYGNNMLAITVMGSSSKQASNLMEWIMDSINASHATITESIGEHDVNVVDSSEYVTVDMDLEARQKELTNNMQNLDTSLKDKTKELTDLEEPTNTLTSKKTVLLGSFKYAILGGVLGGFMMVFFICVAFLMSDRLVSDKELKRRYGIMVLGTFKKSEKKKPFAFVDRFLDNMEGVSKREMEDSQTFEVIAANILNYTEGFKNILLIGTVDSSELIRVQNGLSSLLPGVILTAGGNVCKDAQTIKTTASSDAVIVVEQRNQSSFGIIEQELDLVGSLNKKIIGCVVI